MLRTYKYCLLPTDEQKDYLERLFRACRFVFNISLQTKKTVWEMGRINLSAYDLMKQMTELKNTDCQWLKEFPSVSLEAVIKNLDGAYSSFFSGGGFPRFKQKDSRKSVLFRQCIRVRDGHVRVTKIGAIKLIQHRPICDGQVKRCVISVNSSGKYFASILIDDGKELPTKPPVKDDSSIGIDLGLKYFATLSDGSKVDNPKCLTEQIKRLRVEQRKMARRFKRGAKEQSKGYYKQKLVVVKLHEKIGNKRTDFLQKLTTDLIRNNDTICVESLNISGLQQNNKLAKSISDASWYEFVRMLKYKGEWYGKNIVEIGMFQPSSKTCSNCGYHHKELTLSDRTWDCENCGVTHDRDINAAINIKNIGLKAQPTTAKMGQKVESIGCEKDAAPPNYLNFI